MDNQGVLSGKSFDIGIFAPERENETRVEINRAIMNPFTGIHQVNRSWFGEPKEFTCVGVYGRVDFDYVNLLFVGKQRLGCNPYTQATRMGAGSD